MASTQTTIVVSFGNDTALSDGFYMAEIDELGNEGQTSFAPNDPVKFIVQHDDSLRIVGLPIPTNGTVRLVDSDVPRTKETTILFASEGDSGSLPCLGSLVDDKVYGGCDLIQDSENSVDIIAGPGSFPSLYNFTVDGSFIQYELTPAIPDLVGDETYDVYIVIYFEAA